MVLDAKILTNVLQIHAHIQLFARILLALTHVIAKKACVSRLYAIETMTHGDSNCF